MSRFGPRIIWPRRNSASPFGQTFPVPTTLALGNAVSVTAAAEGDLETYTDWIVKICPVGEAEDLQIAAAITNWGVKARIEVGWGDALVTENEGVTFISGETPNQGFEVPVVGKCFQVHGNFVRAKVFRSASSNGRTLNIMIAVVPGLVTERVVTMSTGSVIPAVSDIIRPIPVFADGFRAIRAGGNNPADYVAFYKSSGGILPGSYPIAMQAEYGYFPIPPEAAFVQYVCSAITTDVVYEFRVRS